MSTPIPIGFKELRTMPDDIKNSAAPPANQPKAPLKGGATAVDTADTLGANEAPKSFSPYLDNSTIISGGLYRRLTTAKKGTHFGGEVADANGVILATFEDEEENNGDPRTGDLTRDGKAWMEIHKDELAVIDAAK